MNVKRIFVAVVIDPLVLPFRICRDITVAAIVVRFPLKMPIADATEKRTKIEKTSSHLHWSGTTRDYFLSFILSDLYDTSMELSKDYASRYCFLGTGYVHASQIH